MDDGADEGNGGNQRAQGLRRPRGKGNGCVHLRGDAGALELEQLLDSGTWRPRRAAKDLAGAAGGLQGAREA